MLRRICEISRAVIVHNPAAAAMVRAHSPGSAVIEIPMLFEPVAAPRSEEIEWLRKSMGLTPDTFLAGVFGHLRESKRVMAILRVFDRQQPANVVLLLAGACNSSDLARAMEPFLRMPCIRRVSYTPPAMFWRLAHSTDVCINLRYPAAGETSAIAIGFMGIRKPVILTESEEVARFPHDACVRVDPGLREEPELYETLRWLAAARDDTRDIGALAGAHIRAHHAPGRVADLYWSALMDARSERTPVEGHARAASI